MRKKNFMNFIITLAITVVFAIMFGCSIDTDEDSNGDNNQEDTTPQSAIYVRESDGHDSDLGSQDEPKKTIQAAIDIAESLDTSADVYVAEGTYSKDYNTDGVPVVLLKEGISIYGGYSDTDWSIREPLIYISTIKDDSTNDGALDNPNRAIEGGNRITENTIIDGFKIEGGDGEISFAIFNHDGASPTIQNNTICGSSYNNSAGIYNTESSSPIIQKNTIIGGSIDVSFGIYNYDSCAPKIQNNRIIGGLDGSQSIGIYNDTHSSPDIQNNLIDGGNGAYSLGIYNYESSSPVIQNNTINGGSNNGNWSIGIANFSASSIIQNNIIFTYAGSGRCGFYEFDTSSDPDSLQNNDIFDCPNGLYSDWNESGALVLYSISDVNDYNKTTQDIGKPSEGNISDNPAFADIDGADDDISTIGDNDWHLTLLSPDSIKENGINGAHSSFNWGFTIDMDENPRSPLDDSSTTGWSIGAYENNEISKDYKSTIETIDKTSNSKLYENKLHPLAPKGIKR